jgi:Hint domain
MACILASCDPNRRATPLPDPYRQPSNLARSRRSIVKAASILIAAVPGLPLISRGAFGGNSHGGNSHGGNSQGGGHRCFLRGTRIRTLNGFRPVERLSVGDVLPTVFTGPAPIREIRHFCYERQGRNEAWPLAVRPIRIRPSAIEDNIPNADLYLSAAHSLYIDGVLVPAWNLVNGTTVTCDDAEHLDVIEYFHIILDQHDVIDAEGALCDTFLETTDHTAMSDDKGEEYHGTVLPAVCAPIASYRRRRNVLKSRLRSALSPIVDLRRPLDCIRDRIEERIPPAS